MWSVLAEGPAEGGRGHVKSRLQMLSWSVAFGEKSPLQGCEGIPGGKGDLDRGRRMAKAWGVGTSTCSPRSHTRGLSVRCRWRVACHQVTPCLQTPLLQVPTPSHLPVEYPLPPAPALTQPPTRLLLTRCSSPQPSGCPAHLQSKPLRAVL